MDILVAVMAMLVIGPMILLLMVLIKLDSSGPVFFNQKRIGYEGVVFTVFKLRTMTDKPRVSDSEVLSGNMEVTKFGAILRRYKLDELPQLLNVINGKMSLVGPRPCLPSLVDQFDENGNKRLSVKPGLTGMAQVNGNIYLSWPQRWAYDAKYVDKMSFLLDVKIILKTILLIGFGEQKFKNEQ